MSKNNKFKIVFTGNIGYAQGLDILPKVAVLLKRENVECQFIIIGDGRYREEFEKEIEQNEVSEMFALLGRKKPEEIPYYLAWCDVAFLSFADNPLFAMTIPAKLQSYLACGMPILAVADGETKRIIEEAKCGQCCELGNEKEVATTIMELVKSEKSVIDIKAQAAIDYFSMNFDKNTLLDQIDKYVRS